MSERNIVTVDLFCGAGGFSEGLRQACQELGYSLSHAAINHWDPAVKTHALNHPNAKQYNSKVEQLHPPTVIDAIVEEEITDVLTDDVTVDLLVAGPECTHFSGARGGKPVSEQKRMSPWTVVEWLQKLDVEAFIIENVSEIQKWGPVEDGQPSRDGTIFDAWINAMNALDYSVNWTTLNAAEYGDPTSRERFFLVGTKSGQATFPAPTHSDAADKLPDRRTASDIIDWSDLGGSIWTRDLDDGRKTPPKNSTMQRIAEGIRRHCDERLAPFADVLDEIGNGNEDEPVPYRVQDLRDRVVSAEHAGVAVEALDEPFLVRLPEETPSMPAPYLVKYYGTSPPQPVDAPIDTVTANGHKYALSTPETMLLRQQDGAHPVDVSGRAVPTIATRGGHAIATATMESLIKPKNGIHRGIHSNPLYPAADQPIHTITSDPRAKLVTPSLVRYSHGGASLDVRDPMPTIATERGGVFALSSPVVRPFIDDYEGPAASLDQPLGTVTSRERFALCVPELWPWGIDIHYRMLQPNELKQAQGFSADYEITGTKEQQTGQIGNAVPVSLAKSLCKHVLTADDPTLSTFGGGIQADPDADIPSYEEVIASDD